MTADNADAIEITKFSRDDWWDLEGPFKTLHHINPLRLNYIQQCVQQLQGKTVIDVGCGGGILTTAMAQRGAQVTGIDLADTALHVAQQHARQQGLTITYRQCSAESAAVDQPQAFDLVTCLEMLEHVPDPTTVVNACQRLCKPGGHIIFSTLNRHPKALLLGIVAAEYVLQLLPCGTHEYAKLIKPSELAAWSRAVGLTVIDIRGLRYNPLTRQARLSNDVSINYLMHTIAPTG